MKLNRAFILASACLLSAGACAGDAMQAGKGRDFQSLCWIAKSGDQTSVRSVGVKVVLVTDLMERSYVYDPQCPSMKFEGVYFPMNGADKKSWRAFDRLVEKARASADLPVFALEISATFVPRTTGHDHGVLLEHHLWSVRRLKAKP